MPELPEVETIVRHLKQGHLTGLVIEEAVVKWGKTISHPSPGAFRRRVVGMRIAGIGRRGKYILLSLSNGATILIHLRMTGRLYLERSGEAIRTHEHVVLKMENGTDLRFHDTRKFGRWLLVDDPESITGKLGPEPLSSDFTLRWLECRIAGKKRMLKPLLLDQTFIAGLGNIYVDEALWCAGLHPCRIAGGLDKKERSDLYRSIREVLRQGIRNSGTTLGRGQTAFMAGKDRQGRNREYLKVFRRTGLACSRCGEKIIRIKVAQRSTHLCNRCQKTPDG